MKSISILITGKVQGVGFRYFVLNKAIELHIAGFVRNNRDGSVYLEAEGTEESINLLIFWCSRGPVRARIEQTIIEAVPFNGYKEFFIN